MAKRADSRKLKTAAEVMTALGGPIVVSGLTGARYKNVWSWTDAPIFPSRYFLVMTFALHQRGYTAPPELWGQVTPAERKQALTALIAAQKTVAA